MESLVEKQCVAHGSVDGPVEDMCKGFALSS